MVHQHLTGDLRWRRFSGRRSRRAGAAPLGSPDRRSGLEARFEGLAARLEDVRVLCGDWERALTRSVTTRYGLTGVFLDPPYTAESGRRPGLYARDDSAVGHRVRDWAVKNGSDPLLRIALCGYADEYQMPEDWRVYRWRAVGSTKGQRERIWFSPHCLHRPRRGRP